MNVSPEIQSIINNFVQQLSNALRVEANNALQKALGGDIETPTKRGPGRPPKANGATRKTAVRRKGAKRTPEELEALTKTLGAYIKKHPGQRIEQIGKELGVPTKELALPVAKLWDAKQIRTTGNRRATTYFPK